MREISENTTPIDTKDLLSHDVTPESSLPTPATSPISEKQFKIASSTTCVTLTPEEQKLTLAETNLQFYPEDKSVTAASSCVLGERSIKESCLVAKEISTSTPQGHEAGLTQTGDKIASSTTSTTLTPEEQSNLQLDQSGTSLTPMSSCIPDKRPGEETCLVGQDIATLTPEGHKTGDKIASTTTCTKLAPKEQKQTLAETSLQLDQNGTSVTPMPSCISNKIPAEETCLGQDITTLTPEDYETELGETGDKIASSTTCTTLTSEEEMLTVSESNLQLDQSETSLTPTSSYKCDKRSIEETCLIGQDIATLTLEAHKTELKETDDKIASSTTYTTLTPEEQKLTLVKTNLQLDQSETSVTPTSSYIPDKRPAEETCLVGQDIATLTREGHATKLRETDDKIANSTICTTLTPEEQKLTLVETNLQLGQSETSVAPTSSCIDDKRPAEESSLVGHDIATLTPEGHATELRETDDKIASSTICTTLTPEEEILTVSGTNLQLDQSETSVTPMSSCIPDKRPAEETCLVGQDSSTLTPEGHETELGETDGKFASSTTCTTLTPEEQKLTLVETSLQLGESETSVTPTSSYIPDKRPAEETCLVSQGVATLTQEGHGTELGETGNKFASSTTCTTLAPEEQKLTLVETSLQLGESETSVTPTSSYIPDKRPAEETCLVSQDIATLTQEGHATELRETDDKIASSTICTTLTPEEEILTVSGTNLQLDQSETSVTPMSSCIPDKRPAEETCLVGQDSTTLTPEGHKTELGETDDKFASSTTCTSLTPEEQKLTLVETSLQLGESKTSVTPTSSYIPDKRPAEETCLVSQGVATLTQEGHGTELGETGNKFASSTTCTTLTPEEQKLTLVETSLQLGESETSVTPTSSYIPDKRPAEETCLVSQGVATLTQEGHGTELGETGNKFASSTTCTTLTPEEQKLTLVETSLQLGESETSVTPTSSYIPDKRPAEETCLVSQGVATLTQEGHGTELGETGDKIASSTTCTTLTPEEQMLTVSESNLQLDQSETSVTPTSSYTPDKRPAEETCTVGQDPATLTTEGHETELRETDDKIASSTTCTALTPEEQILIVSEGNSQLDQSETSLTPTSSYIPDRRPAEEICLVGQDIATLTPEGHETDLREISENTTAIDTKDLLCHDVTPESCLPTLSTSPISGNQFEIASSTTCATLTPEEQELTLADASLQFNPEYKSVTAASSCVLGERSIKETCHVGKKTSTLTPEAHEAGLTQTGGLILGSTEMKAVEIVSTEVPSNKTGVVNVIPNTVLASEEHRKTEKSLHLYSSVTASRAQNNVSSNTGNLQHTDSTDREFQLLQELSAEPHLTIHSTTQISDNQLEIASSRTCIMLTPEEQQMTLAEINLQLEQSETPATPTSCCIPDKRPAEETCFVGQDFAMIRPPSNEVVLSEEKAQIQQQEDIGQHKKIGDACEEKLAESVLSVPDACIETSKPEAHGDISETWKQVSEIKDAAQDVVNMLTRFTEDLLCNYLKSKIESNESTENLFPSEETIRASIKSVSSQIISHVVNTTSTDRFFNSELDECVPASCGSSSSISGSQSSDVLSPVIYRVFYNTSQNNTDESGSDSDEDPQEVATAAPKTEENAKSKTSIRKQTTETRKHNIQKVADSLEELTWKTTSDERLTCNAITEELIAETKTTPLASIVDLLTVAETKTPCESTAGSTHTIVSENFQTSSVSDNSSVEESNISSATELSVIDISNINLEEVGAGIVARDSFENLVHVVKDTLCKLCQNRLPLRETTQRCDDKLVDEILSKIFHFTNTAAEKDSNMFPEDTKTKTSCLKCHVSKQYSEKEIQTRQSELSGESYSPNKCDTGVQIPSSCELITVIHSVSTVDIPGADSDYDQIPSASVSEPKMGLNRVTIDKHDAAMELSIHEIKEVISEVVKKILEEYNLDILNQTSDIKEESDDAVTVGGSYSVPDIVYKSEQNESFILGEEVSPIEDTRYSLMNINEVKSKVSLSSCLLVPKLFTPTSVSEIKTKDVKLNTTKSEDFVASVLNELDLVCMEIKFGSLEAACGVNRKDDCNMVALTDCGVTVIDEKIRPIEIQKCGQSLEPEQSSEMSSLIRMDEVAVQVSTLVTNNGNPEVNETSLDSKYSMEFIHDTNAEQRIPEPRESLGVVTDDNFSEIPSSTSSEATLITEGASEPTDDVLSDPSLERMFNFTARTFVNNVLLNVRQNLASLDRKEIIRKVNRIENMLQTAICSTDEIKHDVQYLREEVNNIATMIRTLMMEKSEKGYDDVVKNASVETDEVNFRKDELGKENQEQRRGKESLLQAVEIELLCRGIDFNRPISSTTDLPEADPDHQAMFLLTAIAAIILAFILEKHEQLSKRPDIKVTQSLCDTKSSEISAPSYYVPSLDCVYSDINDVSSICSFDLEPFIYDILLKSANSITERKLKTSAEEIVSGTEQLLESFSRKSSEAQVADQVEDNGSMMSSETSLSESETQSTDVMSDETLNESLKESKRSIERQKLEKEIRQEDRGGPVDLNEHAAPEEHNTSLAKEMSEDKDVTAELELKEESGVTNIEDIAAQIFHMIIASVDSMADHDVNQAYNFITECDEKLTPQDVTSELSKRISRIKDKMTRLVDGYVKEQNSFQVKRYADIKPDADIEESLIAVKQNKDNGVMASDTILKSQRRNLISDRDYDTETGKNRTSDPNLEKLESTETCLQGDQTLLNSAMDPGTCISKSDEARCVQLEQSHSVLTQNTVQNREALGINQKKIVEKVIDRAVDMILSSADVIYPIGMERSGNVVSDKDSNISQEDTSSENSNVNTPKVLVNITMEKLTQTVKKLVIDNMQGNTSPEDDAGHGKTSAEETIEKKEFDEEVRASQKDSIFKRNVDSTPKGKCTELEKLKHRISVTEKSSTTYASNALVLLKRIPKSLIVVNYIADCLFEAVNDSCKSKVDLPQDETDAKKTYDRAFVITKEKHQLLIKKLLLHKLIEDMLHYQIDAIFSGKISQVSSPITNFTVALSNDVGTQTSSSSLDEYQCGIYSKHHDAFLALSNEMIDTQKLRTVLSADSFVLKANQPLKKHDDNGDTINSAITTKIINDLVEELAREENIDAVVDMTLNEIFQALDACPTEMKNLQRSLSHILQTADEREHSIFAEDLAQETSQDIVTDSDIPVTGMKQLQHVHEQCEATARNLLFSVLEGSYESVKCVSEVQDIRSTCHDIVSCVTQQALNACAPSHMFESFADGADEIIDDSQSLIFEAVEAVEKRSPDYAKQMATEVTTALNTASTEYLDDVQTDTDSDSYEIITEEETHEFYDLTDDDDDANSRFFANFTTTKEPTRHRARSGTTGARAKNKQFLVIRDGETQEPDTRKLLEKETNYGKESILRQKGRKARNTDPNKHVSFVASSSELADVSSDGKVAYNKMFTLAPEKQRVETTRRLLFADDGDDDSHEEKDFNLDEDTHKLSLEHGASNVSPRDQEKANPELKGSNAGLNETLTRSDSLRTFHETPKVGSVKKGKHDKDPFKEQLVNVPKGQKGKFAKSAKTQDVPTTERVKKGILTYMKDDRASRKMPIKQKLYNKFKAKTESNDPTAKETKKRSLSDIIKQIGRSKVSDIDMKPNYEPVMEDYEDTVVRTIDYVKQKDSKESGADVQRMDSNISSSERPE